MDFVPEIQEKLKVYEALLIKWQKAINLVSPSSLNDAWERHILDCVQVADLIDENARVYADLGSGAGFPGLVVAVLRPDLDVHLVESDERKCQFMRTVIRELSIRNVTIHTMRIESSYDVFLPDVISARALADLSALFKLCLPWALIQPKLEMVFMKGRKAEDEIEMANERFCFTWNSVASVTDDEARILKICNLAQKEI